MRGRERASRGVLLTLRPRTRLDIHYKTPLGPISLPRGAESIGSFQVSSIIRSVADRKFVYSRRQSPETSRAVGLPRP